MTTQTLQIDLPADQAEAMTATAAAQGVTLSEFITAAARAKLAKNTAIHSHRPAPDETPTEFGHRLGMELAEADLDAVAVAAAPWIELTKGDPAHVDAHAAADAILVFMDNLAGRAENPIRGLIGNAMHYLQRTAKAIPQGSILLAYKLTTPADLRAERTCAISVRSAYKGDTYEAAAMRTAAAPLPLVRPYKETRSGLPNKSRMLLLNYFDVAAALMIDGGDVQTFDTSGDFWTWRALPIVRELVRTAMHYAEEHTAFLGYTAKRRNAKASTPTPSDTASTDEPTNPDGTRADS